MEYKYHLLKYAGPSSRLTCPNCGRKRCFAPYVDKDNNIIGEEYGRCDHESSCGYVKYPPSQRDWRESYLEYRQRTQRPKPRPIIKPKPQTERPGGICTIPDDIVQKTVRTNPVSDFAFFLRSLFGDETTNRLIAEYKIGVTKSGDAIFYQIDGKGRCRTGKVMKYDRDTGHRIKDPNVKTPITWVHSLLKQQGVLPQEWELSQCLFGEHLLKKYPEKVVYLVEAEKTAIIGAGMFPKAVWVAVGGKTQLGDKVEVLDGRRIVAFPDVDGYDKWVEKFAERPYLDIRVEDLVQKLATEEELEIGADLADIFIRQQSGQRIYVPPNPECSPPAEPYADNPVMQQVMKYISPEYWDNMDALIREFDLELVSITKNSIFNEQ